jgi:hypothetical protein
LVVDHQDEASDCWDQRAEDRQDLDDTRFKVPTLDVPSDVTDRSYSRQAALQVNRHRSPWRACLMPSGVNVRLAQITSWESAEAQFLGPLSGELARAP